jgi:hypothetical protein
MEPEARLSKLFPFSRFRSEKGALVQEVTALSLRSARTRKSLAIRASGIAAWKTNTLTAQTEPNRSLFIFKL